MIFKLLILIVCVLYTIVIYIPWLLYLLWSFKINFHGFRRFHIHGNSSYVVLYTQCLRYNICSAWFLDIRISTCCVGGGKKSLVTLSA